MEKDEIMTVLKLINARVSAVETLFFSKFPELKNEASKIFLQEMDCLADQEPEEEEELKPEFITGCM